MKKMKSSINTILAMLMLVTSTTLYAAESIATSDVVADDEWRFGAGIYFWGASIGGNTANGSDIDIGIDTLLDNLNMTMMGIVSARKEKWTLSADVIYMNVSGGKDVSRPILGDVHGSVKLKAWIVTPTASYNLVNNEKGSFDILFGARYLDLETDVSLGKLSASDSGSVWDGIVGVKGQLNLNEKWYLPYYLDIGAGNSDMTWQGFAGVGYRFKKLDMILAYRYMSWDFNDNAAIDDLNMSGPFLGAKFSF